LAHERSSPIKDPVVVREYATENQFLARRLTAWAELSGPLVEDATVAAVAEGGPVRVVDVGCGTGDFSDRLRRELAVELVALDLSPRMVDLARARGLRAVSGDVQALPFSDDRFGCVLANRVLYHVPVLGRGLAEIARVLRPGGVQVAVTYGAEHLRELWDLVGESPIALLPFSAENGARALREHFDSVERRDFTGNARFPTRSSLLGYLAAYGEFSAVDLGARLGEVREPLEATYRHSVFLAHKPADRLGYRRHRVSEANPPMT
jgi:SAM-dependent methyltransferase